MPAMLLFWRGRLNGGFLHRLAIALIWLCNLVRTFGSKEKKKSAAIKRFLLRSLCSPNVVRQRDRVSLTPSQRTDSKLFRVCLVSETCADMRTKLDREAAPCIDLY